MVVFDSDVDGKLLIMLVCLLIFECKGGDWMFCVIEDVDSDVFYKVMVYGDEGIFIFGGCKVMVKFWCFDGMIEVFWEVDFGGKNL